VETRSRQEFERKARRLEALLHEVDVLEDERAKRSALDAVQALLDLHGEVVGRMLEMAGPEMAAAMGDDELVSGLLLLHGIHPLSVEDRVARALEKVRPYMGSHGGGVEVLEIQDGVVRLRLEGSCHGCPSSTATMKSTIEQALAESAPELARIEVEGVVEPPPKPAFVAVGAIGRPQPTAAWHSVGELSELEPGRLLAKDVAGVPVAFCVTGDQRYAYLDGCPACQASVAGAAIEGDAIVCAGCGRRYDVRKAGRCLEDTAFHLEPVPLLAEANGVRVAVPAQQAGVA
jgi:Fe-S cluster biogenesis protein NfuA/nitrite reductase/ring-hydroxylating ferredoxin subunit